MALTNQKHLTDSTYAKIINADLIYPGWKLYVPSQEEAEAFLATYDKNKPELLYATGAKGQLVVGSWWTAGGEAEGLNEMFKIYSQKYPDVEIVNATVAGGAGTNFKAVLKTRLIGGDPPDTFQLHAGLEVETYSPEQYLEPVDDIYASEGLEAVFPADLLTLLKYNGHYWGVPVNIHRSNVLWYNKAVFEANNLTPPTTFEEFQAVAEALKAAGIQPFVLGTKDGWEAGHIFEDVLAGTLGAEKYKGLWTGETPWTDPGVTQALENFKMMLSYANPDHSAHTWDSAGEFLIAGTGGMMIMGDWTDGWFTSKGFTGYGWAPPPGTDGIFVALSDSFALPKNAPNAENARNWLKVCGSLEGQEAFNPKKGSICARTDCDPALFNEYLQSAMVDWSQDAIVPSVIHGAAAKESWVTDYKDVITLFVASGDVAAAQAGLQQACVDAGVCQ
ncbi:MAG: extracellular solute-binding protein [Anaerolineae bacterium]|nr:extracellular solute-binding protein [Anaerolineae bacterium]